MPDPHLGQLAVAYNFITQKQLEQCLEMQEQSPKPVLIGELLVQEGLLTRKSLQVLLNLMPEREDQEVRLQRVRSAEVREPSAPERDLQEFLGLLDKLQATHLVLSSGSRPFLRLGGEVVELEQPVLDDAAVEALLDEALEPMQREWLERHHSVDFSFDHESGRSLVNIFRHQNGRCGVFKNVPSELPPLDELGLPPVVFRIPYFKSGLVLVTGPGLSGKSTTLAAILQLMNENTRRHVVTMEKPIEYIFESRSSLIAQREIGVHVDDFPSALKETLRADPDVIVVSELNGPEEIACALTAAETGHLVLSTMTTASSSRTINRILDAYPDHQLGEIRAMLASTLRVVLSQELVPAMDGSRMHLACEVLMANAAVRNLIRENRLHQLPLIMQTGAQQGMVSKDDALLKLVRSNVVSETEAMSRADDMSRFQGGAQ